MEVNIMDMNFRLNKDKKSFRVGQTYYLREDYDNEYGYDDSGEYEDDTLVIPSLHDNLPVTIIQDSGFSCQQCSHITIENGIQHIGNRAFSYCKSLTDVHIPNSVTSIGNEAFEDCASLGRISIPKGVEHIGNHAFARCTSLAQVSILDSVKSIGENAFAGCHPLTVVWYNGTPEQFYKIAKNAGIPPTAAIRCSGGITMKMDEILQHFAIPTNRTPSEGLEYTLNDDGTSYSVTGIGTCADTDVVVPAAYNNKPVTSIDNGAFRYCNSITDVIIAEGITAIHQNAFLGCTSLKSVNIPKSITNISRCTFAGCPSLTDITIPDSVTSIGASSFSGCTSLTSIVIPDSVKTVGAKAFCNCKALRDITIGSGVIDISKTSFSACNKLTDIYYNGTPVQFYMLTKHTNMPDAPNIHLNSMGDMPLTPSSGLTLALSSDKTRYYVADIGSCTDTDIVIPSTYEGKPVAGIGEWAFGNCSQITSIIIPESVTDIGYEAFFGCSSLTIVTLHNTVANLNYSAFSGCNSLAAIYYSGTADDFYHNIAQYANLAPDTEVHCVDVSLSADDFERFDREYD
jgi:hypothetical protein